MTDAPAPIPEEMVELAAVAIREADACGGMRDGERVFCDDTRLGRDAQSECCCKDFGRAALTAAGVPALLARVAELEGAKKADERAYLAANLAKVNELLASLTEQDVMARFSLESWREELRAALAKKGEA